MGSLERHNGSRWNAPTRVIPGPRGPQGEPGDPAATVEVGTINELVPSASPTVENVGTVTNAVLDFGLPVPATIEIGDVTHVAWDEELTVTATADVDGNITLDFEIPAGEPGGDAYVGPLPPPGVLFHGMTWQMTPDCHIAQFSAIGWIPLWPQTNNRAVEAGNALLGVIGLWVASDGD